MNKPLRVILIHGTWSSSRTWANKDSDFFKGLQNGLATQYSVQPPVSIEWSSHNRWKARNDARLALEAELKRQRSNETEECEYLLVGHSHGGNIATEAVREHLAADPSFPLCGVICLNTPFLKQEPRSSNLYLFVWLVFCLLVAACLAGAASLAKNYETPRSLMLVGNFLGIHATDRGLTALLVVLAIVLAVFFRIGRYLVTREAWGKDVWEPRPKVLCLSCADDEAITFLGLGEGIANFPQLLFHPIAFGLLLVGIFSLLLFDGNRSLCGMDLNCWTTQLMSIAFGLALWVALAVLGGLLGTLTIALMFGLDARMFIESFASRVLVTYVPLQPARTHFRAIVDTKTPWRPIQLLHSQIYRSKRTIDEICSWIRRYGGSA